MNGRALDTAETISTTGSARAAVDLAQDILAEEMAKGTVVLRIFRASEIREVRFTAAIACMSTVELVTGDEMNAWADGERVVVSEGIVARCSSDDDLALVIAHELAHNVLHHAQRLAAMGRKAALSAADLAEKRDTEEKADELGVRLATAAGYDLRNAPQFLTGLLDANGPDPAAGTHPATARRLALMRTEIAAASLKRRV